MISVKAIKKIIKEELESFKINQKNDEMIQEIGEKLSKISQDFSDIVIAKESASAPETAFFLFYNATSQAVSDKFSGSREGLLKSFSVASSFFSEHVERFPVEIRDEVRSYISDVENLKKSYIFQPEDSSSEPVALSENIILSEIPEPSPGEAPMNIPVDSQGVPNTKPIKTAKNKKTVDKSSKRKEGVLGWSCYRGRPPGAFIEESDPWSIATGGGQIETPSDLRLRNPRYTWQKFYTDPMLGPRDLKFGIDRHGSADPKWSEYWLANQLSQLGINGYDQIYGSMTERDERGYVHSQPFRNIRRAEELAERLSDIQNELTSMPELAIFKKFHCIPGPIRRLGDFGVDILFGSDDDEDIFGNAGLGCEFIGFTYDPRGADIQRHVYCYSDSDY